MRTFYLICVVLLPFQLSAQDETTANNKVAKIHFDTTFHNFGDLTAGEVVEHIFPFDNQGQAALQITHIATTCGCTAPKWPHEPIPVGGKSEIVIQFDTSGKSGIQQKVITVFSNAADPRQQLKIRANILPK